MGDNSLDYLIFNEQKLKEIIYYIFIFFHILILHLAVFILRCNSKVLLLKGKLFVFLVIDIIQKIFINKKISFMQSITLELFLSILTSFEFFLVISFVYEILNKKRYKWKYVELINRFKLSITFTLLAFPYHLFIDKNTKVFKNIEIILSFCFFFCVYYYLKILINEAIYNNIQPEDSQMRQIYAYLKDLNKIVLILFICYYALKIVSSSIENRVIIFYIKISLEVINNGLKYLIFFVLSALTIKLPKIFYNDANYYNRDSEDKMIIIENPQ